MPEQAQPRRGSGARSERRPGEDVDRAGVLVVLAQPHEDVGDQQHRHRGEEERQWGGPSDQAGRALRVDVGGHARRHQRHADADGLPQREPTTESGTGAGSHVTLLAGAHPMRTPYDASVEHVADLDQTERDARATAASTLLGPLAERGVVGVATTFVDNSGIARVKAVPLDRLPHLAAWGAGSSISFDRFRFDDWIAGDGAGREAVGDLRMMPDVRRVVPLGGTNGWAWAPADRYQQDGTPHDQCGRLLLASLVGALAAQGITMKAAVELEWVVGHDVGDDSDNDSSRPRAGRRTGWPGSSTRPTTPPTCSSRWRTRAWSSSSSTPSTRRASSSCPSPRRTRCPPPTPRCWSGRSSRPWGWSTASARRSRRRSRSPAWATAGTCTSRSGGTGRT